MTASPLRTAGTMKLGVVTFPGSNCDYDCYKAAHELLGVEAVYLWHKDHDLQGVDASSCPAASPTATTCAAARSPGSRPIMREVAPSRTAGGPVLGICNGFQILCEAGLLPGALIRNAACSFVCRDQCTCASRTTATPFTSACAEGQVLSVPIQHGEGCYVADDADARRARGRGPRALPLLRREWRVTADANPNGSMRNIAGITQRRAATSLGLMPHPERAVDPLLGAPEDAGLFRSLIGYLSASATRLRRASASPWPALTDF